MSLPQSASSKGPRHRVNERGAGAARRLAEAPGRRGRRAERQNRQNRLRTWQWLAGGIAAAVGVGLLLLVLHSASPPVESQSASDGSSVKIASGASGSGQMGEKAPAFSVQTLTGSTFQVPAGKPVVMYFIAGWCQTCLPESQSLDRIQRRYGDRVAILAVDADPSDRRSTLENFRQLAGSPQYSFAQDASAKISQAYAVAALDVTVVIDAQGAVVYRNSVPIGDSELQAALAKAGVQ